MNDMTSPYQSLIDVFLNDEVNNNVRDINEVLGFISAISASPESLELQSWLPHLWELESDPTFSNEDLAANFARAVIRFYDHCILSYQENEQLILPSDMWLDTELRFTEQANKFAEGYLLGFEIIEPTWQKVTLKEGSEEANLLQTMTWLISKMASPFDNEPEVQALFDQLHSPQDIINLLPILLCGFGYMSVRITEGE